VTYTVPFTAIAGNTITASGWNASGRDNLLALRSLLPDASGLKVGLPLVATGQTSAAFAQITASGLASDAVTTAKILDANVTAAKIADSAVTEAKLDALDSPADNELLTYDNASGRLEWQAASARLGTSFPTGGIIAFPTNASIASGFTRVTAMNGRLAVGAGTVFSVTWTEDTDYGSSWSHNHASTGLTASGAATDSATTAAAQLAFDGTEGVSAADDGHTHPAGAITMGGSVANAAWTIPSYAVVWAKKT
jgi:hypothetical protein